MPGKTKEELNEISKNTRFKAGKEQIEIARQGGIASQKKQRETRLFKDVIQQRLAEKGLSMEMISDKLIENALKNGGRDFEILRDSIGQKPSDRVEVKTLTIEDILDGEGNGAEF